MQVDFSLSAVSRQPSFIIKSKKRKIDSEYTCYRVLYRSNEIPTFHILRNETIA